MIRLLQLDDVIRSAQFFNAVKYGTDAELGALIKCGVNFKRIDPKSKVCLPAPRCHPAMDAGVTMFQKFYSVDVQLYSTVLLPFIKLSFLFIIFIYCYFTCAYLTISCGFAIEISTREIDAVRIYCVDVDSLEWLGWKIATADR